MTKEPTPPDTMEYEIFRVEFSNMTHDFNLEYDYLVNLADKLISSRKLWPEAPYIQLFDEFVTLIEDDMQNIILPVVEERGDTPEVLWQGIRKNLALLGLQLHPIRWVLFSLAWCYVYANHIGDW